MIRGLLAAAFERFPGLRRAAYAAWEPFLRFALLPFRRPSSPGRAVENADVVARTAEYNRAAERYFAEHPEPGFLLTKPYSDSAFARHLVDAGILIGGSGIEPGDTVLEIGAGSCWLSYMLNRYGCRTIAVDVSPTALALGRRLFERDPWTNWALEPRFLAYDGHRLPLDDGACDRVLLYDAFHHVPNQRELLAEMHRVLKADGIAAMSEPGQGHASALSSITETADWGVLENELVVEDVAALAEAAGFGEVNVLAEGPTRRFELPARGIRAFQGGGAGFSRYWGDLCRELRRHHHLLLRKGCSTPTTVRPGRLAAELRLLRPAAAALSRGEPLHVVLRVRNTGDTRWLHRGVGAPRAGWTRMGAHLHEAGEPLGAVVDFDWHRAALDRDVDPGESFTVRLALPGIERPGRYDLLFDLVIEGVTWFVARGASKPPRLRVSVT